MEGLALGDRAFIEEDYTGAIKYYSEGLKSCPNESRLYEARANAHIKLKQYVEAAEDASRAIELNSSNANAFLRKGVAYFHLEEYESAKEAFEMGQKVNPELNAFKTWIKKCDAELEEEQGQTAPAKPAQSVAPAPTSTPAPALSASAPTAPHTNGVPSGPASSSAPLAPAAAQQFEGKYRHQWYQLLNKVTVDVYAKNLAKDQVLCEFKEQHLLFTIHDASGEEEYRLDVDLYGPVKVELCKYEILKTKVEITMVKANGLQWASLEKSDKVAAANYSAPGVEVQGKYPSSYVKKPKDWDKLDAELEELDKKGELDMGDPLNGFFKKIFANGDEDQRRAMMKSFVESNGTVLSTNWEDVGKKKVECTPPEGMEAKKWGKE